MEFLRAGSRPNGQGIQEKDVPGFVAAGGVGALAGVVLANALVPASSPGMQHSIALGAGVVLGHMMGHEVSRRRMEGKFM